MKDEIYVSVDVEALGLYPENYPLASIGACVVGNTSKKFYVELKPDKPNVRKESEEVCGLSYEYLMENGVEPKRAMELFEEWLNGLGGKPVIVAFPLPFDMQFIFGYFMKYLGRSPFGRTAAGIDLKTYAMAKLGLKFRGETNKKYLRKVLGDWGGKHTHRADDDAVEQALLFERLMKI